MIQSITFDPSKKNFISICTYLSIFTYLYIRICTYAYSPYTVYLFNSCFRKCLNDMLKLHNFKSSLLFNLKV